MKSLGSFVMDPPPAYKACAGCAGGGYVRGPIDEATGRRILRDHDACNGSGVLILRGSKSGRPIYGAPKLS